MSDQTEFQAERGVVWAGVGAVMAAMVFYLVVAQSALFGLAAPLAEGAPRVRLLMTLVAASGALGGVVAAWRFRLERFPRTLANVFRACGGAAVLGLLAAHPAILVFSALAVGGALGALLVLLVAGLRPCLGRRRLGVAVGGGVGLAYMIAASPWLATAAPRAQVVVAAFIAIAGSLTAPFLTPQEPSVGVTVDYRPVGLLLWTATFFTLVVLEGALLLLLQSAAIVDPNELARPIGGWGMVGAGAFSAVVVVVLLERQRLGSLVIGAAMLLAVAGVGLEWGEQVAGVGRGRWFYGVGGPWVVSALLYYAARSGRAGTAAGLLATTLWLGSVVAGGVAQYRDELPWVAVVGAVLVVLAAVGLRQQWRRAEGGAR